MLSLSLVTVGVPAIAAAAPLESAHIRYLRFVAVVPGIENAPGMFRNPQLVQSSQPGSTGSSGTATGPGRMPGPVTMSLSRGAGY